VGSPSPRRHRSGEGGVMDAELLDVAIVMTYVIVIWIGNKVYQRREEG
jgi:hypothetical protein